MTGSTRRRILIALDMHSATENGLSTLVSIARRLDASLSGLYFEDSQLMSVAGLPFSTEINYLSAEERVLEPEELLRINRVASARARRLLEELTAQDELECTFAIESGEVAIQALSMQGCDVFLPGRKRQQLTLRQKAQQSKQQLILIYENDKVFEGMLEVARLLAVNGMVSDITILSETPLPANIAEKLPVEGVRLHFQWIASTHTDQLHTLRLPPASLMLMPKDVLTGLSERQLFELLDQLPFPLMLVDLTSQS